MFSLPIEIAWDKFDRELLGTLLRQNLGRVRTWRQLGSVLFKAGTATAKAEGMFIAQKIDMLLEMLLMEPLLAFIERPSL